MVTGRGLPYCNSTAVPLPVGGAGGPGIRSLAHARGAAGLVRRRYGLNLYAMCACIVVTANGAADRIPDPPARVAMLVVWRITRDAEVDGRLWRANGRRDAVQKTSGCSTSFRLAQLQRLPTSRREVHWAIVLIKWNIERSELDVND